jgi:formylmethanofuran dehydrogenase subunit E
VASFRDPGQALEILVHTWNQPLVAHQDHEPEHDPRMLLKSFHGHLGPYVVLGYRMGRLALEKAGSRGHFGISARVHSVLAPPPSCLVDGIQLGSGCTLGKRNIEVFETEGPAYAVFRTTEGREVTIRLRDGVPDLVASLVEEKGVESAGEAFLKMDVDALYEVEQATE